MDGGCGAMCDKIGALVKTSTGSRNAVAFNGGGSSKATAASDSPVRWCGTEGGFPKAGQGRAVWSTVRANALFSRRIERLASPETLFAYM